MLLLACSKISSPTKLAISWWKTWRTPTSIFLFYDQGALETRLSHYALQLAVRQTSHILWNLSLYTRGEESIISLKGDNLLYKQMPWRKPLWCMIHTNRNLAAIFGISKYEFDDSRCFCLHTHLHTAASDEEREPGF